MIFTISMCWALACAISDYKKHRVPNWLIATGFIGAAFLQARHWSNALINAGNIVTIVGVWIFAITIWAKGWWGGADAKFLMVLILAFPDITLMLTMFAARAGAVLAIYSKQYFLSNAKAQTLPSVTYFASGWVVWAAGVHLLWLYQ